MKAKIPSRRLTLLLVAGIVLLGGGVAGWNVIDNRRETSPSPQSEDFINFNPPTEEEKKQADINKEELSNSSTISPPPTANNKKPVTPVITSASTEQINAFVPGIFEEGGTCKATLTQGSKTIIKTSAGFQDATHTTCSPFSISRSDFSSSGNWLLVVSYSSDTAEGQSETKTVKVQ